MSGSSKINLPQGLEIAYERWEYHHEQVLFGAFPLLVTNIHFSFNHLMTKIIRVYCLTWLSPKGPICSWTPSHYVFRFPESWEDVNIQSETPSKGERIPTGKRILHSTGTKKASTRQWEKKGASYSRGVQFGLHSKSGFQMSWKIRK